MPNFNGTGPKGKGEGRRKRYRGTQTIELSKYQLSSTETADSVYGVGRGGRPRGCGKGKCFGGREGERLNS